MCMSNNNDVSTFFDLEHISELSVKAADDINDIYDVVRKVDSTIKYKVNIKFQSTENKIAKEKVDKDAVDTYIFKKNDDGKYDIHIPILMSRTVDKDNYKVTITKMPDPTPIINKITFDDYTTMVNNVDYVRGGAFPGNVTISDDHDHTSGHGKCVKIEDMKSNSHRVKFKNILTPDMLGKKVTVSYWVLCPLNSSIVIGAYSDPNTDYVIYPIAQNSVNIIKDKWTKVSLTFDYTNELIDQIGIVFSSNISKLVYVDDLTAVANNMEEPSEVTTITEPGKYMLTIEMQGDYEGSNTCDIYAI